MLSSNTSVTTQWLSNNHERGRRGERKTCKVQTNLITVWCPIRTWPQIRKNSPSSAIRPSRNVGACPRREKNPIIWQIDDRRGYSGTQGSPSVLSQSNDRARTSERWYTSIHYLWFYASTLTQADTNPGPSRVGSEERSTRNLLRSCLLRGNRKEQGT